MSGTVTEAHQDRFTGRINSIAPGDGVMFVDRSSTDVEHLIAVEFRGAHVVRIWRDTSTTPESWREQSTSLSRWPAGTFVVVVDSVRPTGRVHANRIEIPKTDQ